MLGGNVVLLMRLSVSCLACSFYFFVVITSHFPDVDDIYVFFDVCDRREIFEFVF